jgi:phosphoribosylformylglycinamidine cyclo-ligase
MTGHESAYTRAGVDIEAGNRATSLMSAAVRSTYGPEVLAGIGAFGGLFDASALRNLNHPVLVASTDGVGTKTMLAAHANRWDTIGQDLVNHCINDILVQGAQPLFFLDYVASAKLDPGQIADVVSGVAAACRAAGCALLGGETAEMPGVYQQGELDLAGTIVGVVERDAIIDGRSILPGDVIINLPSSGLHTNGYSLARRALKDHDLFLPCEALGGERLIDALLAIHRCYLPMVRGVQDAGVRIRGLAHITGGGVIDNLPRVLPENTGAQIRRGSWSIPPIFRIIQEAGDISDGEMAHVFNIGLGMLMVVQRSDVDAALGVLDDLLRGCTVVGEITDQPGIVLT